MPDDAAQQMTKIADELVREYERQLRNLGYDRSHFDLRKIAVQFLTTTNTAALEAAAQEVLHLVTGKGPLREQFAEAIRRLAEGGG